VPNKKLRFFTTSGCHLCERAYEMTKYLIDNDFDVAENVVLELIDIADDEKLIEQYGIRIPVLLYSSKELGWPFELEELRIWLTS